MVQVESYGETDINPNSREPCFGQIRALNEKSPKNLSKTLASPFPSVFDSRLHFSATTLSGRVCCINLCFSSECD
jgi:hypothetical protein